MSKLFLSWTKKEKLKIWCHCASVELTVRRRWDLVTNSQILCWCLCRESRNSKSDRSATVYQHVSPLALPTQEEKEKEELRRAQARLGEYLCNTCVCVCACSRFFPRLTVSRLCYTNFRRATVHGRQKGFWILWLICWSLGHDCGVWRMIEVLAAKSYPSRVLSMNQNEATRLTHHSGAAGRGGWGTGNLVPELQCHQDPGRKRVWKFIHFQPGNLCWKCQLGFCSSCSDLHVFSIVRVRAIFVRLVLGTIDHFGRCFLLRGRSICFQSLMERLRNSWMFGHSN